MTNCVFQLLDQRHRQKVLPMIAEAFANDDPLARSQGIKAADFSQLIDHLYDDFVAEQLSLVALDSDLDLVAAVILAESYQLGPGEEGSDAIAALIDRAREPYFADYTPQAGELMHIHFIASHKDYRRQKLVQKLIATCLDRARDLGFQKAIVEASGIRSRKLLQEHLDFHSRVTIDYADFTWNGGRPFYAIAEHGGLTLMDRSL